MDNFIFSLNVVLPLVVLIFLGIFLRQMKVFDEDFIKKFNSFIFKVLLPILQFNNIYTGKVWERINLSYTLFAVLLVLGTIGILFIIVPKYEKDIKNRGVLIQGLYRSNFVILGLPLCTNIFGEEGAAVATSLIAIIIPLYNFSAVIILDLFTDNRHNYRETLVSILLNPLIVASFLGFIAIFFNIELPSALGKSIEDIAKTATPMALIALGGEIKINNIWKNIKYLVMVCAGKLFIIPALTVLISVAFGYRGAELCALFSMMAPSTSVSSYAMAKQYNCNYELAGQIVFITTIVSPFSIFLFVFTLKSIGLF